MLDRYTFRLKELRMTDFMSVEYGRISFSDIDKEYDKEDMSLRSSVTGIYGINGSGKTTLVKAVQIFLDAIWIRGNREAYLNAPSIFRRNKEDENICLVRNGCNYANLSFAFHVINDEMPVHKLITYSFSFKMNPNIDIFDETVVMTDSDNRKETVFSSGKFLTDSEYAESFLKGIVNDEGNEKFNKPIEAHSVLDQKWQNDRLFLYQLLRTIGEDSISSVNGRLLVSFQHEMCANLIPFDEILISNIRGKEAVLFPLGNYVSHATGKIMSFWLRGSDGRITFEVTKDPSSPEELEELTRVVNGINQVVDVILKDTHLVVSRDQENGGCYLKVQKDNDVTVPFSDESYGTRKIIVFTLYLSLLFVRPGMILAIDEFDEGLFEYLLGKILKVIKENAQGQLIFTAHNLRPLEVLPHDCIRFAIPNESNRKNVKNLYRKLTKTNSNSNLREVYYRLILSHNTDSEEFAE